MGSGNTTDRSQKAKLADGTGFAGLIGQTQIGNRLAALVELSRQSQQIIPHMLLIGAQGNGKHTIADALAQEMRVSIHVMRADEIDRSTDLAAIINNLEQGDILFLEQINRIRRPLLSSLLSAMRDFEFQINVGEGIGARKMKLAVNPFTCVGAIETRSECPSDLLPAFPLTLELAPYSQEDLASFAKHAAKRLTLDVEPSALQLIARLSTGSVAAVESMIDLLKLCKIRPISEHDAREVLALFGFDVRSDADPSGEFAVGKISDLSGIEFERLIVKLLATMGFRAEMTKPTGDGGIDIEATLDHPLVGGRYLVQCKRFAEGTAVGSPAIREFYGAVVADRRAIKGIFITNSTFSSQAREFASNLPIELIDGRRLMVLISEHGER
jgi:Holliday junction resolvasome RuvABC ATP-dependent DNA helicase subunit